MKNFRTLKFASQFYRSVKPLKLPSHLKQQLLRAASSVALNLAEGNAKSSRRDKRRFYEIALGSMRECDAILMLEDVVDPPLLELADHTIACLVKLVQAFD